jgi:putative oxidoreductase
MPRIAALPLAAAFSFAVALVHLGAIFAGPAAYHYLGAPQLGVQEAAGSLWPDLLTLGLVAVFAGFGACALRAALGTPERWLTLALLAIGSIYTLRGLVVLPEAFLLARGDARFPPRHAVFSLVSLLGGLAHLVGALPLWRRAPA